jgi:hypothetical protein
VVVWSKTYVCGHLIAGIAGSNPAEEVDVGLLCLFSVCVSVGSGLCDGAITLSEKPCLVCMSVYDLETSSTTWLRIELGCCAT